VKLCRLGLNRCWSDADCAARPGDSCGDGAVSRMTIAKRVLQSVVSQYYSVVNFGFMTFYQDGFFPYYTQASGTATTQMTKFIARDTLKAFGCWTKKDGPANSCNVGGFQYNRRLNADSEYSIFLGNHTYNTVDTAWCGLFCTIADTGTGYYQGSYYTYTDPTGANSGTYYKAAAYNGKNWTNPADGKDYVYWDAPQDQNNANGVFGNDQSIPINGGGSANYCCANCGGMWDASLVPMLNPNGDKNAQWAVAGKIIDRLQKASFGGVAAVGGTPSGCALYNPSAEASETNNAWSYLNKVKSLDSLSCRKNYVIFVTDGQPSSPMDVACDSQACSSEDPTAAGCTCQAVRSAQTLKQSGFVTYVVAFGGAQTGAYPRASANNIAKAGGSDAAYFVTQEEELRRAIADAIYRSVAGSYSTSPATSSSAAAGMNGTMVAGSLLLDSRVDFPTWRGNLVAYDLSSDTPTVAWSASTVNRWADATSATYDPNAWKSRNVWTSSAGTPIKIQVDASGTITNAQQLQAVGMGITDAEAALVARWLLGDPAMGNPAPIGAFVNSTPIDVGPPRSATALPGAVAFDEANKSRPNLTYVGASDGMLHAFFTNAVTVGNTSYAAGQEAFAFIPQEMLTQARMIYAQGGQMPDPKDHIYGVANSPKVKNLCVQNCSGVNGAPVWKTALVMAFGWGGTEVITLDVTSPFDSNGVKTSAAPISILWDTQYLNNQTSNEYDKDLGLTVSVPAFYYAKSSTKDDFRLIFGSAYGTSSQAGTVLINTDVNNGIILDTDGISPNQGCTQPLGLLTDVASARNFRVGEEQQIAAAYFGDTWGNLYRYVPGVDSGNNTLPTGSLAVVEAHGCQHPLHYAPTVVQLDRDNSSNHAGEIYLVQVTNSALDYDTQSYAASKMVLRRENDSTTGVVTADSSFGTGGKIELVVGTQAMCGTTPDTDGDCPDFDGDGHPDVIAPTARPTSTPMAVMRADGNGFQLISTWYQPSSTGCDRGVSYVAVHEFRANTGIKQLFATRIADQPVVGTAFVGGKLVYSSMAGPSDLSKLLPGTISYKTNQIDSVASAAMRFKRVSWIELPN
jgi:hypothetical protein